MSFAFTSGPLASFVVVADADVVVVVTVVADSGADADSGAVIPRKLRIVLPRLMSRWETLKKYVLAAKSCLILSNTGDCYS